VFFYLRVTVPLRVFLFAPGTVTVPLRVWYDDHACSSINPTLLLFLSLLFIFLVDLKNFKLIIDFLILCVYAGDYLPADLSV